MKGRLVARVVLLLAVLTVLWTFPLVLHLGGAIPYTVLPRHGLEVIPLYPGDHLQFYYRLWLADEALKAGHPFTMDTYEFNDYMGRDIASGHFFPLSLAFSLLTVFGHAAAYNLVFILTTFASGLFTFLLLRSYGAGWWGGLAGALAAAFFPYRLGQAAGGHPNGFVFFTVPLLLWTLEEYFRRGRARLAWLAGLVFFLQMMVELHAAFYTFILMAAYIPFRWASPTGRWWSAGARGEASLPEASSLAAAAAAAAVFLLRLSWILLPGRTGHGWKTALASAAVWSAAVVFAWAAASALLETFGAAARRQAAGLLAPVFYALVPLALYALRLFLPIPYLGRALGLAVLAAAVFTGSRSLALLLRARKISLRPRGLLAGRRAGAAAMATSVAVSLAWIFHLKGSLFTGTNVAGGRSMAETLLFTASLGDVFRRANPAVETYIYPGLSCLLLVAAGAAVGLLAGRRPGEGSRRQLFLFFGAVSALSFLFCLGQSGEAIFPFYGGIRRAIPYLQYGRIPSRAMLVFVPAFTVTLGLAVDRLLALAPRGRAAAAAGLAFAAVILVDFSPASRLGLTRLTAGNRVYEEKGGGPAGNKILEVPLWPGDSSWSSIYQYWVTRYRHDIINGYNPVVPPGYVERIFQPLAGVNVGWLGEDEGRLLDELGVGRLVLHEEVFPGQVSLFPFALTLKGLRASPRLRYRTRDEGLWLFECETRAPAPSAAADVWNSPQGLVFQAETPSMRPSRLEKTAAGWAAVSGDPARPAVRGPDRLFPPGRFRASLRLAFTGGAGASPAGLLLRDRAGAVLAESGIPAGMAAPGEFFDYRFVYELEKPTRISFELYPPAGAAVLLDRVYVVYDDQEDPFRTVEFEDLPHAGLLEEDPAASGGWDVRLTAGRDPSMPFVYGPRRWLPPGKWRVSAVYRSEGAPAGTVLAREHLGRVVAEAPLGPTAGAGWGRAEMVFAAPRGLFLDMEVKYSGRADLRLDRLEATRE